MFDFIKKWFKRSNSKKTDAKPVVKKKVIMGDEIRKYAKKKYIVPARMKKEKRVSFTAADIEKGMGLGSRFPMVCSSIDTKKFLAFARVDLIKREGAASGATAKWTFKVK
jgi:hypothetical protein